MATYAIGDVQGCYNALDALLSHIGFSDDDRLWFCGDVVNRGPDSLRTLRFIKSLGERAVTVLGNHDLHLLAIGHGYREPHDKDTLEDILWADDRDELLDWLRRQPLLHHDAGLGYTLVHAGLAPQWTLEKALSCAAELHEVLRSDNLFGFLEHMYGNMPDQWSEELTGWDRLRFITNCFTRLRYCDPQGRLHLKYKGAPGSQPQGLMPWFAVPKRASRDLNIVFGHWSTLGRIDYPGIHALDTGCLWGGALTAMRLDGEPQYLHVDCAGELRPGEA